MHQWQPEDPHSSGGAYVEGQNDIRCLWAVDSSGERRIDGLGAGYSLWTVFGQFAPPGCPRGNSHRSSVPRCQSLSPTSPSNDVLSVLAKLDEASNTGVVPVQCKDNSGRTVLFSAFAWIRKPPTVEFAKEIGDREWILDCADLDMNVGGAPDAA